MTAVHISEADLARDLHSVLEKVRRGMEVVIEGNSQPAVVLRSVMPLRRKVSEVLALTPKNSTAVMDESFAHDIEIAIESHREPLESSAWD